ncbi:hypothetical protein [Marinobacter alexandrii]|uniref:hypothetical protein n=1 Tax=Marinobacter alexandrii TaxID=2570351 RepID=UPI0011093BFE|nr:hypothetical protein [Marinobacter alexandrii]
MKRNVDLYGNQLVAGFLFRFFWSSIFVIFAGLAPILYMSYIMKNDFIADEIHIYIKLLFGGAQSTADMAESVQLLIAFGIFFGIWVSYIKSKVMFIRDFAVYEIMLSISRKDDGSESQGVLFQFISSKVYRIVETLFGFASIVVFIYLASLAIVHLFIPPNINKLELIEGNHNNWWLAWEVSNRARCVDVHMRKANENGWRLIDTSCVESEWFSLDTGELRMLMSGELDLFDQVREDKINPREVDFRVKPYGIFVAGEPTTLIRNDDK